MKRALALARRGSGFTKPNPMVGALLVKDGEVISEGWHHQAGQRHAERECLDGVDASGATLYVTLEPCNHHGKTPPCTEAIIDSGVSSVVIGARDPNPHVKGRGAERLREAGIVVREGVLASEAEELNATWVHWIQTGRPMVALKLAATLDGYIAGPGNKRLNISSRVSFAQVQRLRRHFDAIMVGSGTVLADNPYLTNRSGRGAQPLRVIIDPRLETDCLANVYLPLQLEQQGPSPIATVATTSQSPFARRQEFALAGVDVEVWEDPNQKIDFASLLESLGKRGVQGVLCEGGATLASSLVSQGLVDRFFLYKAPKLLPDGGLKLFSSKVSCQLEQDFELLRCQKVGSDGLLYYRKRKHVLRNH